jgi:hypothetical protein
MTDARTTEALSNYSDYFPTPASPPAPDGQLVSWTSLLVSPPISVCRCLLVSASVCRRLLVCISCLVFIPVHVPPSRSTLSLSVCLCLCLCAWACPSLLSVSLPAALALPLPLPSCVCVSPFSFLSRVSVSVSVFACACACGRAYPCSRRLVHECLVHLLAALLRRCRVLLCRASPASRCPHQPTPVYRIRESACVSATLLFFIPGLPMVFQHPAAGNASQLIDLHQQSFGQLGNHATCTL